MDMKTAFLSKEQCTITAVSLFGRTDPGFLAERLSQSVAC
jgi:hypothetical protein